MIYAIRITKDGRRFINTDEMYDLSVPRATILLACAQYNDWTVWSTINSVLKNMIDDSPTDELRQQLTRHVEKVSLIVGDVLFLEKLSLVEAARYRAPNGQLIKEKPLGMIFR